MNVKLKNYKKEHVTVKVWQPKCKVYIQINLSKLLIYDVNQYVMLCTCCKLSKSVSPKVALIAAYFTPGTNKLKNNSVKAKSNYKERVCLEVIHFQDTRLDRSTTFYGRMQQKKTKQMKNREVCHCSLCTLTLFQRKLAHSWIESFTT